MKIQALSNLYPPNVVGGYEELCFHVMQNLVERGHQVTVLTSNYGDRHASYPGQKIIRTLKLLAAPENIYAPFMADATERDAINRKNIDVLKEALSIERPDIVFIWNLHFLAPSFLRAIEQANEPSVYLLTDNWLAVFHNPDFVADYFARQVQAPAGGIMRFLKSQVRQLLWRQKQQRKIAGLALFPSRFMQALYQQAGLGFERYAIVHHGILPSASALSITGDRNRLINGEELRLLVAGRMVEIKGVHTAIEAMPQITRAFPQLRVRLKIVGDDRDKAYKEKILELIRALKMDEQVSFVPPVHEALLPQLFQQSDIYLFPSLYEPFSLTLIHALRSGIPTVASKAGGTPEIVRHGRTGMLFDPADAGDLARQVICLVKNPVLRERVSQQARDCASQFTFEKMVDHVEAHLLSTYQGQS
ncbi:MAG: glycosyltransferase family 4 protein [Deltaproteobacteria bacterium]|nr:glycosyltransferase family 4 protein [Deltaproteobacteria bacterium]